MIHADFRVIVLANPPGWPFVGNDFYRECGDCFATHAVGNVSAESQAQLLKEIAPDIPVQMVATLLSIFGQLRLLHEEGRIAYPYSVRELVLIARRLQQFGSGGLSAALRDVFDGDSEDRAAAAAIADVVDAHGLESLARAVRQGVPSSLSQQAGALDLKLSQPSTRLGRQLGSEHTPPAMPEDGPKHGEWDGQQHMGGNRFAGGSGGTGGARRARWTVSTRCRTRGSHADRSREGCRGLAGVDRCSTAHGGRSLHGEETAVVVVVQLS